MTCIFRGAQHFGHVHFHFPCQVQHFLRVVLRVFFKSHCLPEVVTMCTLHVGHRESGILCGGGIVW